MSTCIKLDSNVYIPKLVPVIVSVSEPDVDSGEALAVTAPMLGAM